MIKYGVSVSVHACAIVDIVVGHRIILISTMRLKFIHTVFFSLHLFLLTYISSIARNAWKIAILFIQRTLRRRLNCIEFACISFPCIFNYIHLFLCVFMCVSLAHCIKWSLSACAQMLQFLFNCNQFNFSQNI